MSSGSLRAHMLFRVAAQAPGQAVPSRRAAAAAAAPQGLRAFSGGIIDPQLRPRGGLLPIAPHRLGVVMVTQDTVKRYVFSAGVSRWTPGHGRATYLRAVGDRHAFSSSEADLPRKAEGLDEGQDTVDGGDGHVPHSVIPKDNAEAKEIATKRSSTGRASQSEAEKEAEIESLRQWLQQRMGWDGDRALLLTSTLSQLNYFHWKPENVEGVAAWLRREITFRDPETGPVGFVIRHKLAMVDPEEIDAILKLLEDRLEISHPQMLHLIKLWPGILTRTVEQVKDSVEWISDCLKLSKASVRVIALRTPAVLARDRNQQMEPVLGWYKQKLNLKAEDFGLEVLRDGRLLSHRVTVLKLDKRKAWLRRWLGCTSAEATQMMQSSLLWLQKEDDLRDRIVFFQRAGVSQSALREKMLQRPTCLAADVKTRMQPRKNALETAGIKFDVAKHGELVTTYDDKRFRAAFAHLINRHSGA